MAFGYGEHCTVPELCVRLLRSDELLAVWTLPQFEARLEAMRQEPRGTEAESKEARQNGSSLAADAERLFVKRLERSRA